VQPGSICVVKVRAELLVTRGLFQRTWSKARIGHPRSQVCETCGGTAPRPVLATPRERAPRRARMSLAIAELRATVKNKMRTFAYRHASLRPHPEEDCASNPSRRILERALDPPSRRLPRRLLRMRSEGNILGEDVIPGTNLGMTGWVSGYGGCHSRKDASAEERESTHTRGAMDPLPALGAPGMTPARWTNKYERDRAKPSTIAPSSHR
jgi:hypothetical protein